MKSTFLNRNSYWSALIFGALFLGIVTAKAAVWNNEARWNPEAEARFQKWVLTDWNKNFFAAKFDAQGNPNPYYGILNDCADTVYTMRLVFSYENRLPFEINDPTGGSLRISNAMGRWDGETQVTKVRKFINYIHGIVSTHTLPNDTYPVALRKETLVPGSVLLTSRKNHHSWTLKQMLPIGVPHLIYNSRVGAMSSAVLQERKTWPNPDWVFEGMGNDRSRAGFRYWKPQEHLETPGNFVPGASLEQFEIPLHSWVASIQKRLSTEKESTEGGLKRIMEAACDGFQTRIADVHEALQAQRKSGARCMNEEDYDQYSTPSRDHRIFDDLMTLRDLYITALKTNESLSPELSAQLQKMFPFPDISAQEEAQKTPSTEIDGNSFCLIKYAKNTTSDLAEIKRRMFLGLVSSDPNFSLGRRWGDINTEPGVGDHCTGQKLWKPFE